MQQVQYTQKFTKSIFKTYTLLKINMTIVLLFPNQRTKQQHTYFLVCEIFSFFFILRLILSFLTISLFWISRISSFDPKCIFVVFSSFFLSNFQYILFYAFFHLSFYPFSFFTYDHLKNVPHHTHYISNYDDFCVSILNENNDSLQSIE